LGIAGANDRAGRGPSGLHASYLAAVVLWGTILVAVTEILGLLNAITRAWLALAWAASLIGLIFVGIRRGLIARGWRRLHHSWLDLTTLERVFLGAISVICLSLLLVAMLAPPNNVDSLIYHMPRVVHWAQNHSLRHYVATNYGQNLKPYWAEAAILHLRVLWGSDKPANLVQWFSMLTSLIAVSGLSKLLGASRRGQMLAIAFAVSLPIGILQATSTQNDYVAAMWVLCLAYFVVLAKREVTDRTRLVFIGLSLGLGMLTKGTFYPYAFPFLLWFFLPRLKKPGLLLTLAQGTLVAILAIAPNIGLWARNSSTYGGLFGPLQGLASGPLVLSSLVSGATPASEQGAGTATPEGVSDEVPGTESQTTVSRAEGDSTGPLGIIAGRLQWLLRRFAQNLGQNTVMPTSFLTSRLWGTMRRMPSLFSEEFVVSLGEGLWNHEDTAGSLIHLALGLASILWLAILAVRRHPLQDAAMLGLVALTGYMMLTLISYSVELFGVRYQLPFFVLCAPLVAAACASGRSGGWIPAGIAFVLLAAAVPYVLLNNTRPLIGWRPRTRVGSVLTTPPADTLFAIVPEFEDEYVEVTRNVLDSDCRTVLLQLGPTPLEYLWWWLLDAPQSGVRISVRVDGSVSNTWVDVASRPCAVICTTCANETVNDGLPLSMDLGHVRLYSASR
jgi:4-amino-4-deoxy-L-arabinose transferase-like glycosyltransferase